MKFKQVAIGGFLLLAASAIGVAQDAPRWGGFVEDRIEAAREKLGLSAEQIDSIGEIRRERPPRGQNREDARAWRDERRTKIRDVLTDEQKEKLAELQQRHLEMRSLVGARMLGLTEGQQGNRRGWSRRGRGARGSGNRSSRFNRGPGGRRGPGPGWGGRGRGGPNGRFGTRGRPGPRGGQDRQRRGARGQNRD